MILIQEVASVAYCPPLVSQELLTASLTPRGVDKLGRAINLSKCDEKRILPFELQHYEDGDSYSEIPVTCDCTGHRTTKL